MYACVHVYQRSSNLVVKAWGQWMVSIGLRFEPWGKHSGDTQTLGWPSGRFRSRCSGMPVYGHAGSAIGWTQSCLGGFSPLGLSRVAAY